MSKLTVDTIVSRDNPLTTPVDFPVVPTMQGTPATEIGKTGGLQSLGYGATKVYPNTAFSSGVSGVRTGFMKWEAESAFVGVRLWLGSREGLGPSGPVQAILAATETAAINNATNAFEPISGGIAYNTILANPPLTTPIKGWMQATFKDSQFDTLPAACFPPKGRRIGGNNPLTNNRYGNNSPIPRFICTDVIPVSSVPRADGGNRPLVMARIHVNGGRISTMSSTLVQTYYSFANNPGCRLLQTYTTSNDAVGILSNVPADPSTFGAGFYVWPEFIYKNKARSFLITDDSRGSSTYNGRGLGPWGVEGILELSTTANPICPVALGGSGHTQDEFLTALSNVLEQGHSCTDILIPCWSQNGAVQETIGAEVIIGRLTQLISICKAQGIRVFLHTSYGLGSVTGVDGSERSRLACIAWAKSVADNKNIVLVDTDAAITNYEPGGAGITRGRIKPEYNSGDDIHANGLGAEVQRNILKAAWQGARP